MAKLGLGTSSAASPAMVRITARARVVLPAPRPPLRHTRSPGLRSGASPDTQRDGGVLPCKRLFKLVILPA